MGIGKIPSSFCDESRLFQLISSYAPQRPQKFAATTLGGEYMKFNRLASAVAATVVTFVVSLTAHASHSWNNYHWAHNTSPFTLQVIDSVSSSWEDELNRALGEWSQSSKLNLTVTSYSNSSTTRRRCSAVAGKIRVCNYTYGNNGWLGLASINLDSNGHISQGTAKMNDSYSSSFASQYERWHVMCQEIGHLFGLDHTSTDGSSQGTCMDYSQSSTSTAPNQHDYDELATIYSHLDSYNSSNASFALTLPSADRAMAGDVPMGVRIRRGVHDEVWAAPDGKGGAWIHHVFLAPGFEHPDAL
jgi:hypothetical protein